MTATREPIYQALFSLVAADPRAQANFVTMSRYLKHFEEVPQELMPALFMFQRPERRVYKGKGIDPIRTLFATFHVYVNTGNPQASLPATLLNTAADIIDDVISNPGNPQNTQTLGGLVEHVYIEPTIENFEGLLQTKSILVATVGMLIP